MINRSEVWTTVFSLDLSGLQTPRRFQFKLSLKVVFFLDKGVCINQENVLLYCEVFLSLYVSDFFLFSSLFANSVQGYS